MPTVAMLGYFGFANAGDEAILDGTLALLRREAPEFRPVVVSAAPPRTERVHEVDALARSRLPSFVRTLGPGDRFLLSGGGLLQDRTSLRSLFYYLSALRAGGRRSPSGLWAVGVGPLTASGRRLVRHMGRPAFSVVRDGPSRQTLLELGYPAERVVVGADAAFGLGAREAVAPGTIVGYAPRPHPDVDAEGVGREIIRTARDRGLKVALVPFRPPEDGPVCRRLAAYGEGVAEVRELPESPGAMPEALADLERMVAVRLHAVILSALAGVPAVALPYDPKVAIGARALGLPVLASEEAGGALDVPLPSRRTVSETASRLGAEAGRAFAGLWEGLA